MIGSVSIYRIRRQLQEKNLLIINSDRERKIFAVARSDIMGECPVTRLDLVTFSGEVRVPRRPLVVRWPPGAAGLVRVRRQKSDTVLYHNTTHALGYHVPRFRGASEHFGASRNTFGNQRNSNPKPNRCLQQPQSLRDLITRFQRTSHPKVTSPSTQIRTATTISFPERPLALTRHITLPKSC